MLDMESVQILKGTPELSISFLIHEFLASSSNPIIILTQVISDLRGPWET